MPSAPLGRASWRVAGGDVDEGFNFGGAGVGLGGTGHCAVVVAGGDVFRRPVFGGGAGLGFEARPQDGIVHGQFFKTEAAHEAGGAVEGDPGGFDGEGAAAAEGVLEGLAAVVACQKRRPARGFRAGGLRRCLGGSRV